MELKYQWGPVPKIITRGPLALSTALDFTVKYRRRNDNGNADALSRVVYPNGNHDKGGDYQENDHLPENTEDHTIVMDE